jgi:hypothetical protein
VDEHAEAGLVPPLHAAFAIGIGGRRLGLGGGQGGRKRSGKAAKFESVASGEFGYCHGVEYPITGRAGW